MASVDSTGTLARPDHPGFRPTAPLPAPAVEAVAGVRPTRTVNFHLAHMRCAEDAARSLSVQMSVRGFLAGLADETSAAEFAELKAARTSYYLLAAAHRSAARRLERGARIRSRVERIVRPIVRGALRVGRAVTA